MGKNVVFGLVAVVFMAFVSCGTKQPATVNELLLGDWQSLTNEQLQISFTINDEGQIYSSFNNGKLTENKPWQLTGNMLVLGAADSGVEITVVISSDTLIFNNGEEHFVRVLPNESNEADSVISDTELLDDLNQNLGLKLSPVEAYAGTDVSAQYRWSRTTYPIELVTDDLESLNDAYDQLITLLTLNGFEPDSNASTNHNLVYIADSQKIILRCNPPVNPAAGDSLTIEILSGLPQ